MAETAACLVGSIGAHRPVLQWVLSFSILLRTRPLRSLGRLIEEAGMVYLARTDNADLDNVLTPLQCGRQPLAHRAGATRGTQRFEVLVGSNERLEARQAREWCATRLGFSLRAGVHLDANARQGIEQLARYMTRQAIDNEWLDIDV